MVVTSTETADVLIICDSQYVWQIRRKLDCEECSTDVQKYFCAVFHFEFFPHFCVKCSFFFCCFFRTCGHAALKQVRTWQTSFLNCLLSLCVKDPSAETSGFFCRHEQSDLCNVWHVFHLTRPSFLLAFPNWTEWSRCHSQPIPSPGLAFHYRFPDCSGVQDKLVMSKVKLFPGHCESVHLLKRGGGNC